MTSLLRNRSDITNFFTILCSCFDYQAFLNLEVSLIIRGDIKGKMCFIFGHKFCLSPRQPWYQKKSLIGYHFLWKIPWLGVDLHEKFPRLVTKNFRGAQPHHRESSLHADTFSTVFKIRIEAKQATLLVCPSRDALCIPKVAGSMTGHPSISYIGSFSLTVSPVTNFCTKKKQQKYI